MFITIMLAQYRLVVLVIAINKLIVFIAYNLCYFYAAASSWSQVYGLPRRVLPVGLIVWQ